MLLSEDHGPPLPEDLPTFWSRFSDHVRHYPDDLAIVALHQKANHYGIPSIPLDNAQSAESPYLRWSYKALGIAVDQFAAGLQAGGAEKGMPLIAFVMNGAEFLIAFFAANKLGCPFAAINIRNLVNMEESRYMVKRCLQNASIAKPIFVAQDSSLVAKIETLTSAPVTLRVLLDGTKSNEQWKAFEEVMEAGREEHCAYAIPQGHIPNDEAVFFTSGTTSLPKGMYIIDLTLYICH
jgi:acyl-CoA synthetase (AMP-forming)/AMP-acid ligase II